jgi:hypothetical protein
MEHACGPMEGHGGWHGGMGCPYHGAKKWMSPKFVIKIALMKAKVELLSDRLKPRIEAKMGDKMDEVADLIVEAMMSKKQMKHEMIKKKMELKERFREIFYGEEEEEED